ncbi:MAG: lipoate--protein ligase [Gracilibacteraceae bacterium]|jgi:lipoate-protein ligase A|nr:lipoate--protein ligase [Gracilibacteraceae bacterium]
MLYIRNENTNPYFNLAMEEYLFNLDDNNDYFLLWQNEPTIVVGKYQNTAEEINSEYVKEKGIHVVRRITGGGAVYHDLGNLNYTFINKGREKKEFDFRKFTMPIVKALGRFGVEAELSGRNDITIAQKKFSGNAQYVKQGKVLHHGTLLFNSEMEELTKALKVSEDKFQSKGIKSVRSRVTNIADYLPANITVYEFKEMLLKYMFEGYAAITEGQLKEADINEINMLMKSKYMNWDWNYGASPEFNVKQAKRFEGGRVEVLINIKNGIIQGIKFYGDFFGSGNPEDIEAVLIGKRYLEDEIKAALSGLDTNYYFRGITLEELLSCIL